MKEQRLTGTIKYWNGRKGFGFIEPESGDDKQIFVHIKAFSVRKHKPSIGLEVNYILSADDQGRPRADKVMTSEELAAENETLAATKSPSVMIIVGLIIVVAVSAYFLS